MSNNEIETKNKRGRKLLIIVQTLHLGLDDLFNIYPKFLQNLPPCQLPLRLCTVICFFDYTKSEVYS